jgi:ubiquinone biosynthesis protein UbiJ
MITERIESLLNRQVCASPRAMALVADLRGRHLAVQVSHTPWQWTLASDGAALRLSRESASLADATIRGTALSLAALAASREPTAAIRRGDVTIEGDAEIANRFRELGALLHPDVEEELSRLVGDVPAHNLGLAARAAAGWLRTSLRTTAANAAEYLAHERRDLVPRAEADGFLRDVDRLREDVDRLAARIDALAAQQVSP